MYIHICRDFDFFQIFFFVFFFLKKKKKKKKGKKLFFFRMYVCICIYTYIRDNLFCMFYCVYIYIRNVKYFCLFKAKGGTEPAGHGPALETIR